jgi:hypothetical protein
MGYAVQVDTDALGEGVSGLVRVAESLEGVAGRFSGACATAAGAAGGAELSAALEAAGLTGRAVLGQASAVVGALAAGTAAAATDYRLVEAALAHGWTDSRNDVRRSG